MRTTFTFALALFVSASLFAQAPKGVANKAQLSKKDTYEAVLLQQLRAEQEMTSAKRVLPVDYEAPKPQAAAAVNPIQLGRASNVYSILRSEQNQVYANDDLDMVAFIHRQDVTIHGGGTSENGKYRYDLSINNGASFTNDIGVLNPTYTRPSRYPNLSGFNASGNTNPFNAHLVYAGPSLDASPDWDGHVNGVADVSTGSITPTEHYDFIGQSSLLPGGLCEGKPGEFWIMDTEYNTGDSVFLYKGTYDTQNDDISFVRAHSVLPNYNTASISATATYLGGNMAASPNGDVIVAAWLGDLTGGHDSTLSPIFMISSDSGATWGSPIEVDLQSIPGVSDSLTNFWIAVDSATGDTTPAGTGNPTCAFDYDITVDVNGNPHMVVVIGNGSTPTQAPDYSIFSGIEKWIIDVNTTDGGTTWNVDWIAPILTFRGEFGTPDPQNGSLISQDNFPQISRNESGEKVFYSWVDSDTCVIGFGESDNIAPNLRISGMNVATGDMSPWKVVTDGDILWDGTILYPTMAPTTITIGSNNILPIVFANMIQNDQLGPTQFLYLGNDAVIVDADLSLSSGAEPWLCAGDPGYSDHEVQGSGAVSVVDPVSSGTVLYPSYPNPTSSSATIAFDLEQSGHVELALHDIFGKRIMTIANREFGAGAHDVQVDVTELPTGVYVYTMKTENQTFSNKMVVTK